MAKTNKPLLSLEAHGSLTSSLTFQKSAGQTIVRRRPVPTQANSLPQQYQRWNYLDALAQWKCLTTAQQATYESLARRYHISGLNYYLRYLLSQLPDIEARYRIDERPGNTLYDRSKLKRNLSLVGGTWEPGVIDYCLHFDGIDDHALSAPTALNLAHTFSLSMFYRPHTSGSFKRLFEHGRNARRLLYLSQSGAGTKKLFWMLRTTATFDGSESVTLFENGTWYFITLIYDGSFLRFYVNGVLDQQQVFTGEYLTESERITLAYELTPDAYFLHADLDHVTLFNRKLTEKDMLVMQSRRWPV